MFDFIVDHYNYWTYIGLMIIGFYAMMTKRNLIKKIIGMNIFQSAIIFFFISSSVALPSISLREDRDSTSRTRRILFRDSS